MMRPCSRLVWMCLLLAMEAAMNVGAQSFQWLGNLPGGGTRSRAMGVSADGQTVVGSSSSTASGIRQEEAFVWTGASGMLGLGVMPAAGPFSVAYGASADGGFVVGTMNTLDGAQPFRWTQQNGLVLLHLPPGREGAEALGVSGDGFTVVGYTLGPGHTEPFIWTQQAGMVSLTPGVSGTARAITTDGRVIVGYGATGAFYWTQATGLVDIGNVPGHTSSFAQAVSADGAVVVGGSSNLAETVAFRWTQQTGMVGLGLLPRNPQDPNPPYSIAKAVSGNGTVVVGDSNFKAFIWDERRGMRDMRNVLINDYGLNLNGWGLTTATGISADGRVIVGTGAGPNGEEAWMAVIPEPGALGGLIGGLGILSAFGMRARMRR